MRRTEFPSCPRPRVEAAEAADGLGKRVNALEETTALSSRWAAAAKEDATEAKQRALVAIRMEGGLRGRGCTGPLREVLQKCSPGLRSILPLLPISFVSMWQGV